MRASDFDFPLPERLIAQTPTEKRDESRLFVLRPEGPFEHRGFRDVIEYLNEGDMLLLNKTKVLPVRFSGVKPTGGRLDLLLVRNISGRKWEVLMRGRYSGRLRLAEGLEADIIGGNTAELIYSGNLNEIFMQGGLMPLPPYIRRKPEALDMERYQTVYAADEGSIAAPTAGLHFTKALLEAVEEKGVLVRYLTLHVGRGTFSPMRAEAVEEHPMEAERFEIEERLLEEIAALRGRLLAVGTTVTRALEGFLSGRHSGERRDGLVRGLTDIFIYPGYDFRAVGGLITNFHLPRSTPLMLASAFAGRKRLLGAYEAAVGEKYRFFSYGDAMLLL